MCSTIFLCSDTLTTEPLDLWWNVQTGSRAMPARLMLLLKVHTFHVYHTFEGLVKLNEVSNEGVVEVLSHPLLEVSFT